MKEYPSEHFHATIKDEFLGLVWSQLTITLCSPPQFQGPASVIFPIPSPTTLPPAIDNTPAHLPETVTPAPKTRDGTVTAIGASPRHLPLPRVMESPLLRAPASSLTEQHIREIIREELQEVWVLEHVAREAASHAIDALLHRLDHRDRQWQQEFVPHAVDLISRSVISSLDTARSHRDMPDATAEDYVNPSCTDGVDNSPPSDKAAGIQPHTSPPGRSADDMTMFLAPGDKVEETFERRRADPQPIERAAGAGDEAPLAESAPTNTTLDSLYRIGNEWDTDSEDVKIGVLSDSPWKNEEGVPLAIANLNRPKRGDPIPPELRPLKLRTGTQSTHHPDAATEDTSASTATATAPTFR
eukprot:scaffold13317_cov92-Alexandrium_tamarense.AAC.9